LPSGCKADGTIIANLLLWNQSLAFDLFKDHKRVRGRFPGEGYDMNGVQPPDRLCPLKDSGKYIKGNTN
jgi:hypothetical protein